MSQFAVIGKNVPKVDAYEKVTGQPIYAADLKMQGMLYGKIVRCMDYAHARVTRLDFSEALKLPGVVKVLGPEDVTQNTYNTGACDEMVSDKVGDLLGDLKDQTIFTRHVRHQGDAICGVIATSEEIAERAAAKVIVEYEPLNVFMTPSEAEADGALQLHPDKPNNQAFQLPEAMFPGNSYGWGDADDAMKEADLIVEDNFYVNKQKQCQMEPHAYIAQVDGRGRLNCWSSGQMPKITHLKIARLFDLPMSKVKIHSTTIGGGFGARLGIISEPETCAMALAVPGRPVKVQTLREEDWIISESRHAGDYWMRLGFKKDGTPVACQARFKANTGAYFTHASGVPFTTGAWLSGMYKFGALGYQGESYFSNQAPAGAYRGYGNPQTNFVLEQLIDRALNTLEIDPVQWRLDWHKGVGDDGWCFGVKYPSCQLSECLRQGAEAIEWNKKSDELKTQTGVKRRGIGVSVMNHTSGATPMLLEHTVCTVMMNEDGSAVVSVACSDLGQGSHTVLQQIAAEALGLEMDEVHLKTGDSDANGFDIGSHASRTTYVGGNAIMEACDDVKKQLLERATRHLDTTVDNLEFAGKTIFAKNNPENSITVAKICHLGVYNYMDPETGEPEGAPGQIFGFSSHFSKHNSPPFGACFVEVEIDTETGEIDLLELVHTHDIGRTLHPAMAEGQMVGGAQQGIGMALTEEIYYDEQGLALNSSFTDYKMYGSSDMPKMKVILVEDPDPHGPYGAKSVGEAGLTSPVGAIANAVYNALGIQFKEAPITPEKVLKAIKENGLSFS